MNRVGKILVMTMLLLALMCAGSLAEEERKGLFAFINAYSTPVTRPALTQEEQEALMLHPGNMLETQYATYTVTDAAFDGNVLYVLVEAEPKEGVLLISGYGYEEMDPIFYEDGEADGETFAQRAVRENKQLIVSAISSGYTQDEISLEGESYYEAFYLDGVMQLFGRIPMKEYMPVYAGKLRIREAVYGDPLADGEMNLRVEPSAKLQEGVWSGAFEAGPLTVTKVQFIRSEIGASLRVYAHVRETLSEEETAQVRSMEMITPDIELFSAGYYVMNAQGEMQWEDPVGGESILFVSKAAAGEAMPEQLTFSIRNYISNETLGEVSVPLALTSAY